MTTYHISEKGRPNICRAQDGNCPIKNFGGNHFDNKEDARKYVEDVLSGKHGATKTLTKKKTVDVESKPKTPRQAPVQKEITIPESFRSKPKKLSKYETAEKEIAELRAAKETATAEESKKIDGKIRGKSIHLAKYKKDHEESLKNEQELTDRVFGAGASVSDTKKAISEYLNNPVNVEKVQRDFENAGYDLNHSPYLRNLAKDGEGSNLVIRQALKNSHTNEDSSFLITVAEAAEESEATSSLDRFSTFQSNASNKEAFFNKDGEFIDPEFDKDEEDIPEFLKDDPDFVIDEDEEEETEEEDN